MKNSIYHNFQEVCTDLNSIPVPKKTDSYTPIRHTQLMRFCLDIGNTNLQKEPHSYKTQTDKDGNKLAFTINWPSENKEFGLSISGVNSYDKSCSMKVAIGSSTWACLNTQVFGDIMIARLHTGDAAVIIREKLEEMFFTYERKFKEFLKMVDKLKEYEVSDKDAARQIGLLRYHEKIINDRESNTAIKHWNKNKLYKAHTAWDLYSALTDALKLASARYSLTKHADLHTYFQDTYHTDEGKIFIFDADDNGYISIENEE